MPSVIPVHFGISGAADSWADKSIWYVFLLPALQTVMTVVFFVLYYKPQYTNMPSTMWLMTLDKKYREVAFGLIRNMMAGTIIIVGVLLTYMAYGMNNSAVNESVGLSPTIMLMILGVMFIWLIFWSVKIYRETRLRMKSIKKEDKNEKYNR